MARSRTPRDADPADPQATPAVDGQAPADPIAVLADDGAPMAPPPDAPTPDAPTQAEIDRAADAAVEEILSAPPADTTQQDTAPGDPVWADTRPEAAAPFPTAAPDPAPPAERAAMEEEEAPAPRRSFAATALALLVGAIVVAGLALWAAPHVAPHLPPALAAYITPVAPQTDARLAVLEDAFAAQKTALADLQATLAAQQAALDEAASVVTTLGTTLGEIKEQTAPRLDQLGAEVAALAARLDAAPTAEGGVPAAALAEIQARIDALTPPDLSAVTAMQAELAAMSAKIDTTAAKAAEAETARVAAEAQIDTAVKGAALKGALASLAARLATGASYDAALAEVAGLTGATPPPALATGASGLATVATLTSRFPAAAQGALAADVASGNDGTTLGATTTWLLGQVSARPTAETAGDSTGAILSRVEARLGEGALAAALTEATTLTPAAQTGLGDWLTALQARVAADQALDAWTAELGANG